MILKVLMIAQSSKVNLHCLTCEITKLLECQYGIQVLKVVRGYITLSKTLAAATTSNNRGKNYFDVASGNT